MIWVYIGLGILYTGFGSGLGAAMGMSGTALILFVFFWPVVMVGAVTKVFIDRLVGKR